MRTKLLQSLAQLVCALILAAALIWHGSMAFGNEFCKCYEIISLACMILFSKKTREYCESDQLDEWLVGWGTVTVLSHFWSVILVLKCGRGVYRRWFKKFPKRTHEGNPLDVKNFEEV
jgi:hypothetical protein